MPVASDCAADRTAFACCTSVAPIETLSWLMKAAPAAHRVVAGQRDVDGLDVGAVSDGYLLAGEREQARLVGAGGVRRQPEAIRELNGLK